MQYPCTMPSMRAVVQRVTEADCRAGDTVTGSIEEGLLVLLGVEQEDGERDAEWMAGKIVRLRIFDDEKGVMNRSLLETGGSILAVSQFTLHGDVKKGNRPSYNRAAAGGRARALYEYFVKKTEELLQKKTATGRFGAEMHISLVNHGPVTIILDSRA